jgi:hypothetical protein
MPVATHIFQTDGRRRATMPALIPANGTFSVEAMEDGTFRLVPMTMIPTHQLWAWRPEVQQAVARALEEPGISLESPEGQAFLCQLNEP